MEMDAPHRAARRRRERWARAFRPSAIDLMIVAHAPPSKLDRFFYFPHVREQDYLFREVARAVLKVESDRVTKRTHLSALRDAGVYVIDTSLEPLAKGTDLAPFLPGLLRRLHRLKPKRIILVKVDVYDAAFRALRDAGLPVVNERVPFPGSGQQRDFRTKFARALNKSRRSASASTRVTLPRP